jgi:hypothetical protein
LPTTVIARLKSTDYGSDFSGLAPVHVKSTAVLKHVALIGLRWYLRAAGSAAAASPAAPAAAGPPRRRRPPVKTFIVFFDFDKSNLTEKAQEVVAEAVKAAKANGFVKVMVTGHTDTVGSDTYNQALSSAALSPSRTRWSVKVWMAVASRSRARASTIRSSRPDLACVSLRTAARSSTSAADSSA